MQKKILDGFKTQSNIIVPHSGLVTDESDM